MNKDVQEGIIYNNPEVENTAMSNYMKGRLSN